MPITVIVASDSRLLRQLLSEALDGRSGLSVVATAPDYRRTLALADDLQADVAIVSMEMPDAELLVQEFAGRSVRVVALGRCQSESVAPVEDGTLNDVVAAIHGAMHGAFTSTAEVAFELDLLTPTERRVLLGINEGQSNKEIANDLGVAVPTVKHHVHSLLTKLGVRRRGEAAAFYRQSGPASRRQPRPARKWTNRISSLHQG
jgi:two-component system, NarL family, nitrate/nitrite response regulator NarL